MGEALKASPQIVNEYLGPSSIAGLTRRSPSARTRRAGATIFSAHEEELTGTAGFDQESHPAALGGEITIGLY